MELSSITQLLAETIGLDVASVGQATLEQAVEKRIRVSRAKNPASYLLQIADGGKELENLIEEVVVPETWFMREPGALQGLQHYIFHHWLPKHPTEVLRVASIPCSSGEEPYSLAMSMLDWGLTKERFHIDAVDISWLALERASRAEYGVNSFRSSDTGFRDRHFDEIEDGRFKVSDRVRSLVTFCQGNVLALPSIITGRKYDAIFCRNLLIYFGADSMHRLLAQFKQVLSKEGLLFVGLAEAHLLLQSGMLKHGRTSDSAFAFPGRARHPAEPASPVRKQERRERPDSVSPRLSKRPSGSAAALSTAAAQTAAERNDAQPLQGNALREAQAAADAGRLDEAQHLCEALLQREPFAAQAYYLLGLIAGARGNPKLAAQLFRKVVYLDPAHAEALLYLAQAGERAGDGKQAHALRERARRNTRGSSDG